MARNLPRNIFDNVQRQELATIHFLAHSIQNTFLNVQKTFLKTAFKQ
jgi:hypothetical protein